MPAQRKIIIFGGSFAPPTLAHEAIMAGCLALPGYEAVWVVPSKHRADKTMAMSDDDRLRMLHLLARERFGNDPRVVISDLELRLPGLTQTARTAALLDERYPDVAFSFVFGDDSYLDMPHWEQGIRLQRTLSILLIPPDAPLRLTPNVRVLSTPAIAPGVSSTAVRKALQDGQPLDHLVSPPIEKFLRHHQKPEDS